MLYETSPQEPTADPLPFPLMLANMLDVNPGRVENYGTKIYSPSASYATEILIGFIHVVPNAIFPRPIIGVYVLPELQGQGKEGH